MEERRWKEAQSTEGKNLHRRPALGLGLGLGLVWLGRARWGHLPPTATTRIPAVGGGRFLGIGRQVSGHGAARATTTRTAMEFFLFDRG